MRSTLGVVLLFNFVAASVPSSPSERAEAMLKLMDLEDKLRMMRGSMGDYVGNIEGNGRLGIPKISMQDGPQGFRITKKTGAEGSTTAWPSSLNIASSFDAQLAGRWAIAMASEFVAKGSNMQLAPGLGIARVPTSGRIFEYLCGEDPVLGSLLSYEVVKGIQSQGIIANAKHFINNEIETDRMTVSATVDERVRFELYYPPFQAAIDAGVLSAMCSYNKINGVYACENDVTMHDLRVHLGFEGWIVSDWLATHSTVTSVTAGLDQEMPVGIYLSEVAVKLALQLGQLKISDIDRSVLRILTSMYTIGLFDSPDSENGNPLADVTSAEHSALAREVAGKSTVLLKNSKNLLPLDKTKLKLIGVFGDETTVSGGGSGHVTPSHGHVVTPTEGIKAALKGFEVEVEYFKLPPGDKMKALEEAAKFAVQCDVAVVVVATTSIEGYDRPSLELGNLQDELIKAVSTANSHTVVAVNAPGAVLMPWATDVSAVLIAWMPGEQAGNALADVIFGTVNPSARLPVTLPNKDNEIDFSKSQFPGIGFPPVADYSEGLFVGYRWYDAHDVTPLFPFGHGLSYTTFQYSNMSIIITNPSGGALETATVVTATAATTKTATAATTKTATTTVAVFETDGHVEDGLLAAESDNKAIIGSKSLPSDPLSPPISPSSSLPPPPITSPNRFDSMLSITIRIKNSGTVPGTEIVQLYMSYPDTWGEPVRQLKGIITVSLQPKESSDVKFNLSSQDLSIWDKDSHQWALPCSYKEVHKYDTYIRESSSKESPGVFNGDCTFDFFVGASSRDFRAEGSIQIKR